MGGEGEEEEEKEEEEVTVFLILVCLSCGRSDLTPPQNVIAAGCTHLTPPAVHTHAPAHTHRAH